MFKFHPKVRAIVFRISLIWLAAHIGCLFGHQAYFWTFNSLDAVASSYRSEWPAFFAEMFNLRLVEYTFEFGVACHNAPGMSILLLVIIGTWSICVALRKWTWLAIAMFISFTALDFFELLAWKV
jgi:hypothetical protein